MSEDLGNIKNVVRLVSKLQNLCEGFDQTNKSALITAKLKVLLEISKSQELSPNSLCKKLGFAKSNMALICNELNKQELITKTRSTEDYRVIYYSVTEKGQNYLKEVLTRMEHNFNGQLAYKNNSKKVDKSVNQLLELIE